MATKTSFLSTIKGFITALITQAKVRSAFSTVSDEAYSTIYKEEYLTGIDNRTITTPTDSTRKYYLLISKTGNKVDVSGRFFQDSVNVIVNFTLVSFGSNTEFYVKTNHDVIINAKALDGSMIRLSFNGSGVFLLTPMPPNKDYYFNITYFTND